MLRPKKKLTRREIKEDPLVTAYFRAVDFLHENARYLTYGLVAMIVVLVLSIFYGRSKQSAESKAAESLVQAQLHLQNGETDLARDILQNSVDSYAGTPSAGVSCFYLANAYFQAGDFQSAHDRYLQYIDDYGDFSVLTASALGGVAASLEELGQFEEAARAYEEAADKYPDFHSAPDYLAAAGRCYRLANKPDEALRLLQAVLDKYPEWSGRGDVQLALAELHP